MAVAGEKTPADTPVIEGIGVPEIFCSGTITEVGPEVVVIIVYRERTRFEAIERTEVARCIMSRADYDANLRRAYKRWACGSH